MSSLQASIVPLAKILGLNPHALYERQLALMSKRLLPPRIGRGPGSGTPFSPETVAVLLISMLATDGIKDCAEATRALCDVKLTAVPIGQEDQLGSPRTFKAAMINALSSDAVVDEIYFLRVHRKSFIVEVFTRADGDERLHLFEPSKRRYDTFEGMAVVVELRGGTPVGKGGGSPALGKIRALLRSDEIAAQKSSMPKNASRKSKSKDHRK